MINFFKTTVALGAVATLAACGSSGGGGDGLASDISLREIQNLALRAEGASLAQESDLNGTAIMSGVFLAEVDVNTGNISENVIIGDMDVTANFNTGDVTGSATNLGLYDDNDSCETLDGCVVTTTGTIDGALDLTATVSGSGFDGTLGGNVSGTLVEDDSTFSGSVDLDVTGAFGIDDDGLLAEALVDGTADLSVTDSSGTSDETLGIDGAFLVAE